MRLGLAAAVLVWVVVGVSAAPPAPLSDQAIAALLQKLQAVLAAGRPADYLDLLTPGSDRQAAMQFAQQSIGAPVDRAVVRERDRTPLKGVPPGDVGPGGFIRQEPLGHGRFDP